MTVQDLIQALLKAQPQSLVFADNCIVVNVIYDGANVVLTDGSEDLSEVDDLRILNKN